MDAPAITKKNKILLVEDDEFLNEIYSVRFTNAGFDVEHAKDGIEGLDKAKLFLPDLILLDLILPKMSGYELLEKLRQNESTSKTKVIIFTNVIPNEGIERVARFGITDYILKSDMNATSLIDKVTKILSF